jgi:hypothetical protein
MVVQAEPDRNEGWRPLKRTLIFTGAFPSTDVLGYYLPCLRHWS